ncbi:MAG: thiamine-phosphate kinase [Rhodocyclales bacterium CG_4_10_14_3_um_filter_68_10]|nr:MAG: thiamine-phosphate kinase [Rhodocyclales bacterium CG_4_10_14_3_um_filter_68_10]
MVSEFELIRRHFTRPTAHTVLGVGDDAALMRIRPGMELAASTDMLVAGVHFLGGTDPRNLGWKALAVNVSDLAAMGAQPRWALLAAALPSPDEVWIAAFAEGLFACAHAHSIDIVGGDTTRGPLTINVSVFGEVPAGEALRRSGAHAGDDIWISGTPGTAALGLAALRGRIRLGAQSQARCVGALERPQPRVALGLALRGLASAAIDVSDGLLADLGHIAECSALAAEVRDDWLPWAPLAGLTSDATLARECLLAGGDDYELAFTAAAGRRGEIEAAASRLGVTLTRIGRMQGGPAGSVVLVDAGGSPLPVVARGFDHFESAPE